MSIQRLYAVLKLPKPAPLFIERTDVILQRMTGNAFFGSPDPALPVVGGHLADLRTAQANRDCGPAAVAARDAQRRIVTLDLEDLRSYVQRIADTHLDESAIIIESAGMFVRARITHETPDFEIRQGLVSGAVDARVRSRGRGTTYWWEHSVDQRNWIGGVPTRIASTSFAGLVSGTTYFFRYQTLTAAGLSDWSQIVSFMVK